MDQPRVSWSVYCCWLYYCCILFLKLLKNSVVNFNISLGDVANFPSSSSTFEFWNYFLYNIPTASNMFELSDILFISSTCLSISFSLFSCTLFFFIWCYISFLSAFVLISASQTVLVFLHYMYCKYPLFSSHAPLFFQLLLSYLAVDGSNFDIPYLFSSINLTISCWYWCILFSSPLSLLVSYLAICSFTFWVFLCVFLSYTIPFSCSLLPFCDLNMYSFHCKFLHPGTDGYHSVCMIWSLSGYILDAYFHVDLSSNPAMSSSVLMGVENDCLSHNNNVFHKSQQRRSPLMYLRPFEKFPTQLSPSCFSILELCSQGTYRFILNWF